jgi:15-hydroxyprostaglandin dehydrogenase (NAD)
MILTGSVSAIHPFPPCPQYSASKHAIVGLVRSVGPALLLSDNIAVNCTCPAFIPTPLSPPGLKEAWPQEWITTVDIVARAIRELSDDDGVVNQDGKSDGKNGEVKTGQVVECVIDKLYYREGLPFADESEKFLIEESYFRDGLWQKGIAGELGPRTT